MAFLGHPGYLLRWHRSRRSNLIVIILKSIQIDFDFLKQIIFTIATEIAATPTTLKVGCFIKPDHRTITAPIGAGDHVCFQESSS